MLTSWLQRVNQALGAVNSVLQWVAGVNISMHRVKQATSTQKIEVSFFLFLNALTIVCLSFLCNIFYVWLPPFFNHLNVFETMIICHFATCRHTVYKIFQQNVAQFTLWCHFNSKSQKHCPIYVTRLINQGVICYHSITIIFLLSFTGVGDN